MLRRAPVGSPTILSDWKPSPQCQLSVFGKVLVNFGYPGETATVPADPVLALPAIGLGVDFDPADRTDGEVIRLADVLGTPVVPQRIDFTTGLRTDADVPKAFTPPQVAVRTGPADLGTDELGVFERLRLIQTACEGVALRLQFGPLDPAAVEAEADAEAARLVAELPKVRAAAKRHLDAQIDRIEVRVRQMQQDDVPSWKIMADPDYRSLHDLYTRRDRLDALLTPAATP